MVWRKSLALCYDPSLRWLEFLTYLNVDDRALEEFTRDKLPSAGIIAGRINGQLQFLRDYLNEDASHFSFSFNSMRHIVKFGDSVRFDTHLKLRCYPYRVLRFDRITLNPEVMGGSLAFEVCA